MKKKSCLSIKDNAKKLRIIFLKHFKDPTKFGNFKIGRSRIRGSVYVKNIAYNKPQSIVNMFAAYFSGTP